MILTHRQMASLQVMRGVEHEKLSEDDLKFEALRRLGEIITHHDPHLKEARKKVREYERIAKEVEAVRDMIADDKIRIVKKATSPDELTIGDLWVMSVNIEDNDGDFVAHMRNAIVDANTDFNEKLKDIDDIKDYVKYCEKAISRLERGDIKVIFD